jgi:hypothetical protein
MRANLWLDSQTCVRLYLAFAALVRPLDAFIKGAAGQPLAAFFVAARGGAIERQK